jgi:hypothetical protein
MVTCSEGFRAADGTDDMSTSSPRYPRLPLGSASLIKVFLPHILSSSRTSIVGSKNQLHAVLFAPAGNNPQDQIRWRCFLAQNVLERDTRVSMDSLECGNTTLPAGKCETKIRAFRTTNVWLIDAV